MEKRQPQQEGSVIHLISEILDKLIDTQSSNIQSTTQMRESIQQAIKLLEEVNRHFTNGFRSDIKNHVTDELEGLSEKIEKWVAALNSRLDDLEDGGDIPVENQAILNTIVEKLDKLYEMLDNPWYWAKVIAAALGSLAIIMAGIMKLFQIGW